MKKIRVLIIEDLPDKHRPLLDRLSESTFDADVRATAVDAISRVNSSRFDVFFIDLQLTREKEGEEPYFEGIGLGERLREISPDSAIIMYSASISRGKERNFPHYEACMEVADALIGRSELFSISASDLENRIRDCLASRRSVSNGRVFEFDRSLRTRAVCDRFGRQVLENLASDSARELKFFNIKAIQAGYSGASILRIQGAKSQDFKAAQDFILKIDRSRDGLSDEIERRPGIGSKFDARSALPRSSHIVERDGVYGIAIREVKEMTLLRDFLETPRLKRKDEFILRRVVNELLIGPAQEAEPWENFGIKDSPFSLRITAGSEVADFLSRAAQWKHILSITDIRGIGAAQAFLNLVLGHVWCFTVQGRLAGYLHGDFHCRNVFVAHGEGPLLIDFGRAEVYPRLFDIAALDADLVLGVFDSIDGREQDFGLIEEWFDEVVQIFPYSDEPSARKNTNPALWLRGHLIEQMLGAMPQLPPVEYVESLVFHYIRYLRFSDVSLPKKILAARLIERLTKRFGLLSGG